MSKLIHFAWSVSIAGFHQIFTPVLPISTENAVLLHLNRNLGPADRIFYFQESAECDFVVQRNEHVDELIQVTWDMPDDNTREREIDGLLEASRATGCDKPTIITIDEESAFEINGKTIVVMPAWKWALGKY